MKNFAVIMAGGSGTRFWPKSSKKNPKQLLALTGNKSQLQLTWQRLDGVITKKNRLIIGTEALKAATLKQLPGAWYLGEPVGRNTMAAVCWSAWAIHKKDPAAVIAVLPADAFISNVNGFRTALKNAFEIAQSEEKIVCLGIKPTFASTAYGYIQKGEPLSSQGFRLQKFVEKPNESLAQELFKSGEFSWNAGIFVFPVALFVEEVRTLAPEFAAFFDKAQIKKGYKNLPSVPIDIALMEKTDKGAVIDGDFGWNDLGSWPALAECLPANSDAGVIKAPGGFCAVGSTNIVADVGEKKFLGLVGVDNLIVVETKDAILVCHKDRAQDIKTLVGEIQKNKKLAEKLL